MRSRTACGIRGALRLVKILAGTLPAIGRTHENHDAGLQHGDASEGRILRQQVLLHAIKLRQ